MDYDSLAALRAAEGALYLDQKELDWNRKMLRPVSMMSTRNCTLAQLHERYRLGLKKLGLTDEEALHLGFRGCSSELGNDMKAFARYYNALNKAWENEVQKRHVK